VPFARRNVTWNVHSNKPYRLECVQQKTDVVSNKRNSEVESKWQNLYTSVLDMVNLLQEKISVNRQLILVRFQSIESCFMSLDKISCGKLLIRKLISFHFFDAESQLNQLGLKEEFKCFKKWFN
jgi:iron uptake system EfeUOB component EfeO/EfeM